MIERGNRLIVFIDELDRCKPSFAVKLRRLKSMIKVLFICHGKEVAFLEKAREIGGCGSLKKDFYTAFILKF